MSFSFKKLYLVILIFTLLASSFNLNKVFAVSYSLPIGQTDTSVVNLVCPSNNAPYTRFDFSQPDTFQGSFRYFTVYLKNVPDTASTLQFMPGHNYTGSYSFSSSDYNVDSCKPFTIDLGSSTSYAGDFYIALYDSSSNRVGGYSICGSSTASSYSFYGDTMLYDTPPCSTIYFAMSSFYPAFSLSATPPVPPGLSVSSVLSPLNNDVIEAGDFYLQFQLSNIPSGYHFYSADVYLVPSTGYDLPTYQLFYFGDGSYVSTGGVLNVPISGLPDNGYVIGILNVKYIEDWVQFPYVPDYKTASYDGSAVQFVVNNSGVAGPPVINTQYPLSNISLDSVCDANQLTSAELVTCRAVAWLFLPTDSTIVRFYEASTYFSSKAPFRYVKELWEIVNDETNVTSESLSDFSVNIPIGTTTLNVPTLTSTTFSDVFGSSTWLLINNFLRAVIYATIIIFVIISIMNFV